MKKLIVLGISFISICANAQNLTLEEYIGQVKSGHSGYKAALSKAKSAELKLEESGLRFSPYAFAEGSYTDDQSPRQSTASQGNSSKNENYKLGISKETRFGLNSKIFYSIGNTNINGADPAFVPLDTYYNNSLNIELSQSLWKNAFGKESRAFEEESTARNESQVYAEKYNALKISSEAEVKYWSLAINQTIDLAQKEALARSSQILKYTQSRKRKNLADQADVLQAKAAFEFRQLEVESSKNLLDDSLLSFNSARGIDDLKTSVNLESPKLDFVLSLAPPSRESLRLDTLSAQKAKDAAVARTKSAQEELKPGLEVFANVSLGGLDESNSKAVDESFSTDSPTSTIGIRFNIPLDRSLINSVNNGIHSEKTGAELIFKRRLHEQEVEWKNLTRKFDEAKRKLQISKTLESAQLAKLNNEKKIQKKGRSTTYQVLLFEQDYINAQVTKLQFMREALTLHAQLIIFGGLK